MPRIRLSPRAQLVLGALLVVPSAGLAQTQAPPPTQSVTIDQSSPLKAKPELTGIRDALTGGVPACLKANTNYVVSGKHLNAKQLDRSIRIGGHGTGFALKVHTWSNTRVTVSIVPRDFALVSASNGYYMAVSEGGLWASDLSFRWRPCAAP